MDYFLDSFAVIEMVLDAVIAHHGVHDAAAAAAAAAMDEMQVRLLTLGR